MLLRICLLVKLMPIKEAEPIGMFFDRKKKLAELAVICFLSVKSDCFFLRWDSFLFLLCKVEFFNLPFSLAMPPP